MGAVEAPSRGELSMMPRPPTSSASSIRERLTQGCSLKQTSCAAGLIVLGPGRTADRVLSTCNCADAGCPSISPWHRYRRNGLLGSSVARRWKRLRRKLADVVRLQLLHVVDVGTSLLMRAMRQAVDFRSCMGFLAFRFRAIDDLQAAARAGFERLLTGLVIDGEASA